MIKGRKVENELGIDIDRGRNNDGFVKSQLMVDKGSMQYQNYLSDKNGAELLETKRRDKVDNELD